MIKLNKTYIAKIKIVDIFLNNVFKMDSLEFIKIEYEFKKLKNLFVQIIKNEIDDASSDYLEKQLGDMKSFRDKRSNEEYACDLLLGWIVEDSIIKILTEKITQHIEKGKKDFQPIFIN